MTEAAHQMARNPLPPAQRKPGTCRHRGGPGDRASWTQDGDAAAAGCNRRDRDPRRQRHGGLREQSEANAEAFTNGWFRTGDQGVMDAEGYLTHHGRLKEIINRGGEKISPREVDEVLMDHPAVQQVRRVRRAARQARRGRRLRRSCCATERRRASELREFAASAARRLQGAAQDSDRRPRSQGRHRQAAAHRARREARRRMTEDGRWTTDG